MLAAFRDAAVAAAFRAPAVRGVEGEEAGIEFLEGLVAGRAARFGGEEDELFVGGEEFDEAFADVRGRAIECSEVSVRKIRLGLDLAEICRDDDIDVVFLEAFEAGEAFGVLELLVDEQAGESLFERPLGDLGVVAFFAADDRGQAG